MNNENAQSERETLPNGSVSTSGSPPCYPDVVTSAVMVRSCLGEIVRIHGQDFVAVRAVGNRLTLQLIQGDLEADRIRAGMSQKDAAEAAGISQSLVSKVESGYLKSPDVRKRLRRLYRDRADARESG